MSNLIISTIESFPTELFTETFFYLDGCHIYKAFYGLNSRLSMLTLLHNVKHIDLREVKPYQYREMFSMIDRSRVISLKLSEHLDDEQLNHLFDKNLNNLRYLTLDSMVVLTMNSIICRDDSLSRLEAIFIWFNDNQYDKKICATSEWIFKRCLRDLKSLKYFSIRKHNDKQKQPLSIHRFSLHPSSKYPSWQHLYFTTVCTNQLEYILSQLPNLQTLTLIVELNPLMFAYPTMLYLRKCTLQLVRSNFASIVKFLRDYPNLQRLSLTMISADTDIIDDHQWQYLIEHYLPQLKQFEIDMWTQPLDLDAVERLCTITFQKNSFWHERKTCVTVLERKLCTQNMVEVHININFNVRIKKIDMFEKKTIV